MPMPCSAWMAPAHSASATTKKHAGESECCAFLDFDLRSRDDELELRVTAPDGAEAIADDLVQAFAEGARA